MNYLAKNPFLLAFLKTCDTLLPKSISSPFKNPTKILVANLAHRGDVVVATSFLHPLKQKYPDAEIGFLLGSWSKEVLEGHPLISKLHIFDHWKLNRSPEHYWKKIASHLHTSKIAKQEILSSQYDMAIDLYPYFPNAIPLLASTHIPCRIGYTSGGFGSLLTEPRPWLYKPQSMSQYHNDLLDISSSLSPSLLADPFTVPPVYAILHMGTGDRKREQSFELWKRVIDHFSQKNYPLFLTGKGSREKEKIRQLIAHCGHGINLCDQLTWKQFVFLVQQAKLIVSVETAIMHIASSSKTPNLILAPKIERLWMPDNPASIVVNEETLLTKLQEVLNNDFIFC